MKCNMDCFNCPYDDCINDGYYNYYNAEKQKIYREEHKEEIKQWKQNLYNERKTAGICTRCGKRPIAKNSTSRCIDCLLEDRRRMNNKRRKKGVNSRDTFDGKDYCIRCGRNKPVEGYKMCPECLERARKRAEYARTFIDRDKARKEHEKLWKSLKAKRK